jgi:hypothetical protein
MAAYEPWQARCRMGSRGANAPADSTVDAPPYRIGAYFLRGAGTSRGGSALNLSKTCIGNMLGSPR